MKPSRCQFRAERSPKLPDLCDAVGPLAHEHELRFSQRGPQGVRAWATELAIFHADAYAVLLYRLEERGVLRPCRSCEARANRQNHHTQTHLH